MNLAFKGLASGHFPPLLPLLLLPATVMVVVEVYPAGCGSPSSFSETALQWENMLQKAITDLTSIKRDRGFSFEWHRRS